MRRATALYKQLAGIRRRYAAAAAAVLLRWDTVEAEWKPHRTRLCTYIPFFSGDGGTTTAALARAMLSSRAVKWVARICHSCRHLFSWVEKRIESEITKHLWFRVSFWILVNLKIELTNSFFRRPIVSCMYEYTSSAGRRLSGGVYYGRSRLLKLHFRSIWQYPFFSSKELHRCHTYNTYKVICCQPKSRFAGHSRSSEVVGKVHVSSFHLLSATTLSSYWLILRMEFFWSVQT